MSGGGVFNINGQQAGTINNVAGDQTIGRQDSTLHAASLGDIGVLRAALAELSLPANARRAAIRALDAAEEELQQPAPDKRRVAGRLEEVAGVLGQFGVLVSAADRLVGPLQQLAGWLGPAGHALAALLS
jgi:ATP phosphoribosyltransferase regulatory subunit HisZ